MADKNDTRTRANLKGKDARRRLKIRREPYWQDMGKGCALGFRRGPDTWIARWHNPADKRHLFNALKDVSEYSDALEAAQKWWKAVSGGASGTVQRGTVLEALRAYIADKREHGRNADDIERRIDAYVDAKPLANIRLEQLTRDAFKAWRTSMVKGRVHRTVNREVRCVVAGLNWAVENGYTGNPLAWKLKPLSDDVDTEADKAAVFLSPAQRKTLINAADASLAVYLRGLELTGARPGELAAATVADFNAETGTLTLRTRKGRDGKSKARAAELSTDGVAFFKAQCRSKLPGAPLLIDSVTGGPWERHTWAKGIREAVARANDPPEGEPLRGVDRIPIAASAYSFRHAAISEMLALLDPITVARHHGTSIPMIERYYAKSIPSRVRDALDGLKAEQVAR
jgi:integrase